ncbi:protein kinase domain-containing protein [Endozoicomonas euniceicola]|uniref:Protein kinase n=1 Tax=Endozoicomonas euniceicola TaxID=1234143 RepID=A0ABY6GV11_9GAMM|nr:protein kinase [Endozoicomonas euniceicola]UYM16608.1 protein kinase [Endozoicomonas euniceicola]
MEQFFRTLRLLILLLVMLPNSHASSEESEADDDTCLPINNIIQFYSIKFAEESLFLVNRYDVSGSTYVQESLHDLCFIELLKEGLDASVYLVRYRADADNKTFVARVSFPIEIAQYNNAKFYNRHSGHKSSTTMYNYYSLMDIKGNELVFMDTYERNKDTLFSRIERLKQKDRERRSESYYDYFIRSLTQLLTQEEEDDYIPTAEAARYILEMIQAVHYLHIQYIVHNDLHPGNIMFDTNDTIKIIDFFGSEFQGESFKQRAKVAFWDYKRLYNNSILPLINALNVSKEEKNVLKELTKWPESLASNTASYEDYSKYIKDTEEKLKAFIANEGE